MLKCAKRQTIKSKAPKHGKLQFLKTKHEGQVKTFIFFVIYLFLSFLACRVVQGGTEFAWIAYLPANILKFMLDRAFPGAAAAAASDAAGAGEAAAACMEAAAAAAY